MIETISRTGYAFLRYLATRLLRIDLMLLALVVTLTTIGFIALFSAGYSFPWRIEGQIRNIAVARRRPFRSSSSAVCCCF